MAEYLVPEVSCEHCKIAIETEVVRVEGVTLVQVDVPTRTLRVEGDASHDEISSAVERAGYTLAGAAER
jgi:copper chaperone CopZ